MDTSHIIASHRSIAQVKQAVDLYLMKRKTRSVDPFIELLSELLDTQDSVTSRVVQLLINLRPATSLLHLLSLLSTATAYLSRKYDQEGIKNIEDLHRLWQNYNHELIHLLRTRDHSYTCPRRFLSAQIIFPGYFPSNEEPITVLDLGTGLGLLPYQLNFRPSFDKYVNDLRWPLVTPVFRQLPIRKAIGVNRPPLPDPLWVQCCYAETSYYQQRSNEVFEEFSSCRQNLGHEVQLCALDILRTHDLNHLIRTESVRIVTCFAVLHQNMPNTEARLMDALVQCLRPPWAIILGKADSECGTGMILEVFTNDHPNGLHLGSISNNHMIGSIEPGLNYETIMFDIVGWKRTEDKEK